MSQLFTMLEMPDGKVQLTCTDCALFLHEQHLLDMVQAVPLPASEVPKYDAAIVQVYRFAPGVDLERCKQAVKGRHRG